MRSMKKISLAIWCCVILMLAQGQRVQGAEALQLSEGNTEYLVEYSEADIRVIPDKYNTGCKGDLTALVMDTDNPMWVNDIQIVYSGAGERFVLDFGYRNKDKTGTIYIENYDFSSRPFVAQNEHKAENTIKVVFNNCKFSRVNVGRSECNLSYEFNNCSMISFYGSNTVLNYCKFGGSYVDGIVPFSDIEVNDCFFSEMTGVATENAVHIDGTQIYGHANNPVYDVSYNHCRFEMPSLRLAESEAYVNACIMLGLEFNSAKDLWFRNCIVNGGGYSIYAASKSKDFTFDNVGFDGISFGAAAMYGIVYPSADPDVKMSNLQLTDSLYIGSVWKDEEGTHFSVTNDTKRDRELWIDTNQGTFTYTIPACPTITKANCTEYLYEDMPFDIDIVVPTDCQYAVCFDTTLEGFGTQIRFVNWSNEKVYLSKETVDRVYAVNGEEVLLSGKCGNNITFTLTHEGVLTLSGMGATYNYHSAKSPEWSEYMDYIKEIRVEEGIEGLGSMIFRKCSSVQRVSLPDTLTTIGQYAFGGCVGLQEITLPPNISTLGKYVFSGTVLQEIHYAGDNWNEVTLGEGNDNLLERLVYDNGKSFRGY